MECEAELEWGPPKGMSEIDNREIEIGLGLKLTFALLIVLILCGNGLLLWQFHLARLQTERLKGLNQELNWVLRLQVSLLSVHQKLDKLAQSRDAGGLENESEPLRKALLEETQAEMSSLAHLPYETHVEPELQPTLQAIEITLPTQLEAINGLAASGDWKALHLRLDNELKPVESLCASLVAGTDQEVSADLALASSDMRRTQLGIFVVVQVTMISTFFVAAVLGVAITRRIITLRVHERVTERTRIARELHDTLLQSFQALMFQFQAARNMVSRKPEDAVRALDEAIAATAQAIVEGRDAIQDLRPDLVSHRDLPEMLNTTGRELASAQNTNGPSPSFRLVVEGKQRELSPILQDEVYRITREVIRNAFRHADASHIEAEIHYDANQLRLRIRDDGKGIAPEILAAGGRSGHWGITGIRERAQRIGAVLNYWTEVGAGTEVELRIPAAIVYERHRNGPILRLFPKAGGDERRS
jgi:signal transduction histidine kinase